MSVASSSALRSGRVLARSPARIYLTAYTKAWHSRAGVATLANFKPPEVKNEPNHHYLKGSKEREGLIAAIQDLKSRLPVQVHPIVDGQDVPGPESAPQLNPSQHATKIATSTSTTTSTLDSAISGALSARSSWSTLPFADRASIFLKAADLISTTYRYPLLASTMLGQGKNAWQAEIDAAAELADFLRFNVEYASQIYNKQPVHNSPGVWNRLEYRPLEGFVYAITPFNFTAIAGNLPAAPALMGNVVVWKPSPSALLSNQLIARIFKEAGLPDGVIQFVPGDAQEITSTILSHPQFSGLHFTGSTSVFKSLLGTIGTHTSNGTYNSYPRVVGETGGKNFHILHPSADVPNAIAQTLRASFEFQGQKCSACSRVYVPKSLWTEFTAGLKEEVSSIKQGSVEGFDNFCGPVIHAEAFRRLANVQREAESDDELELLVGGTADDSTGYFVRPTIYTTTDPSHPLLRRELFGPILVAVPYNDDSFAETCTHISRSTNYALTGAIFAQDRNAVRQAEELLRDAAGNFYVNTKCTGAVVGQQPFGGGRGSGTNDKAGSTGNLERWVSVRAVKEEFVPLTRSAWQYGSNVV